MSGVLGAVNRAVLALGGLVLLAAGLALLTGRHAPLLRGRRSLDGGWWWAVSAALAACVLLALWWLAAQLRRPRLAVLAVDTGDGGFALLRGRALEEAVAAEAAAVGGVADCRVALRGRRGAPTLRVALELEPHAVPADVLAALAGPVLTHARTTTALPALGVEARLKATPHPPQRAV
ncbi:alkaline shock response membrane anchor protein AmaP [Streptomyces sp. NPDC004126]|uniref:alkaline shock response membrane anchor protein AmaP n=1 Tax=Streptomyces sp. NPDC004126 TaxID=3390695 RepID=UPI003CFFD342